MNVIEWELGDWEWAELVEILFEHGDTAVVMRLYGDGLLNLPRVGTGRELAAEDEAQDHGEGGLGEHQDSVPRLPRDLVIGHGGGGGRPAVP